DPGARLRSPRLRAGGFLFPEKYRDNAVVTVLHFSHANGFPAACYRKMFSFLERDFEIDYVNMIGHDPRHPVTDSWPHLVAEQLEHIERYGEPVLGAGHSLGGYLTMLAALDRPELFRAIVVLDSPVIGTWAGRAFGLVKRFGLVDRVTPAGANRRRGRGRALPLRASSSAWRASWAGTCFRASGRRPRRRRSARWPPSCSEALRSSAGDAAR